MKNEAQPTQQDSVPKKLKIKTSKTKTQGDPDPLPCTSIVW
jgi:hypothetical protein